MVYRYRCHLLERGMSTATINNRLSAIRSLVRLARTVGLVNWHIEVGNLKSEDYRDMAGPGLGGVRRLLERAGAHKSRAHATRDVAMIRLLFDLGLRRASVTSLDVEHVDLAAGKILVLLKGRTQRSWLSLPAPTREALRAWLYYRGEQPGPLFVNFDRAGEGSAAHRQELAPTHPATW